MFIDFLGGLMFPERYFYIYRKKKSALKKVNLLNILYLFKDRKYPQADTLIHPFNPPIIKSFTKIIINFINFNYY